MAAVVVVVVADAEGAEAEDAAAAVGAPNKLLNKPLSRQQPLNPEPQGQKRHPQPRNSEEAAAEEVAAAAADLAFRPANTQSRFRPAAMTLLEPYAFRRIREYKSQKLTERNGRTR